MFKYTSSVISLALGITLMGCGNGITGGSDGAQGPQGPQGPQGLQGNPGQNGAQGIQGPAADLTALVFGRATDNVVINGTVDWSVSSVFNTTTNGHQPLDFNFGNLTINPGSTLLVPPGITIRCRGQFGVGTGSFLTVLRPVEDSLAQDLGTVSMAGTQAVVTTSPTPTGDTLGLLDPFPSLTPPLVAGGSGGPIKVGAVTIPGGQGGGSVAIRALGGIVNSGVIRASGTDGLAGNGSTTGGGGGGLVILVWGSGTSFTNTGTVRCLGGNALDPGQNTPGAGGGGGGFIRLAGPSANLVGGTFDVTGGAGSTSNGAVAAGTRLSPGGSSEGFGGGVTTAGGDDGEDGLLVRTTVTDPIDLFSLAKQIQP